MFRAALASDEALASSARPKRPPARRARIATQMDKHKARGASDLLLLDGQHCSGTDRHSTAVSLEFAHIGDDVTPLRPRDAGDICGSRSWRSKTRSPVSSVGSMVTAACVTMGLARSADLHRMMLSLRDFYPNMATVIVSAGLESPAQPDQELCLKAVKVRKMRGVTALHAVPPTGNLSALRNLALRHVRTPFALVLDDDFVFTNLTRVDALLARALEHDVDVVAGFVRDELKCREPLNSLGCRPGTTFTVPTNKDAVRMTGSPRQGWAICDCVPKNGCDPEILTSAEHPGCIRATYVRQFFLAKTTALVTVGWDDRLPYPDHWHGMWRLRLANARMLWCDATVAAINHVPGIRHYEVTRNITRQEDAARVDKAERDMLMPHAIAVAEVLGRNRVVHGLHQMHRYLHPLPNLVSDSAACAAALDAARCRTPRTGRGVVQQRSEGCSQDINAPPLQMDQGVLGSLLRHRWLLFVGDSTLRMMFHLILGVLNFGWTQWPVNPNVSFGARLEPENASCLQTYSWLTDNESHTGCLEDVFVRQYGFRLTMTWVDYHDDSAWLDPLRHLLQQSVGSPDAIVVGIGAWFAKAPGGRQFPHVERAFTDAVRTFLNDVEHSLDQHRPESYFRPTWPSHPRLIFAGITYCARKLDRFMRARVAGLNERAMQAVTSRTPYRLSSGSSSEHRPAPLVWNWVDRLRQTDCQAECVGAGFHVIGNALNRVSMAVLGDALGLPSL